MGIRGSLREASLPDVLQLLAMGKKTGCLSVTHRNEFGYIYFDRGRISYASIVNRRDRLGETLVKHGLISQAQLDDAVAGQGGSRHRKLGEILVGRELISREELHRQIRLQIEDAVYFLFTWPQGTFNFEPDVRPEDQDVLVSINPESLLLEGARRVDEWELIQKKIAGFDLVFDLDSQHLGQSDVELTPTQETVAGLVDGRRNVAAIVDESGLGEFEVAKAMYELLTAGFLHRVATSSRRPAAATDTRIDEHRNLGAAFYKAGMQDEAMREFRRVLELRADDPHACFYVGLTLMRQSRWSDALDVLRALTDRGGSSVAAYHNLAYVLERLGRFDEAREALDAAVSRGGGEDARVMTSLGVVALKTGDVSAADAALTAARALWGRRQPVAPWYHYAALAAALNGDVDRAIAWLEEGVAAYPTAPLLLTNLAAMHGRRGAHREAARIAECGLREDPASGRLLKTLGEAHYHLGDLDEALDALIKAVHAAPDLGPDLYLKLGDARAACGERAEAVRCWERALEIDPEHAGARERLDTVRRAVA